MALCLVVLLSTVAAAAAQEPFRVGGDIPAPEKTKHVDPVYPFSSQMTGSQGTVPVELVIGIDGRVTNARVLRPVDPALAEAALEAVRQWEYHPTVFKGIPVQVLLVTLLDFTRTPGGLADFGQPGAGGGAPPRDLLDLTGEWLDNEDNVYQVRSAGSDVFWHGLSPDGTTAHIYHGTWLAPDRYVGRWVDVPPTNTRHDGRMTIRIIDQNNFETVGSVPNFGDRQWRRAVVSPTK